MNKKISKMQILIFFVVFFIFAGCSSKTVYNQANGKFLNTENSYRYEQGLVKSKKIKEFKKEKMRSFKNYLSYIYSEIEKNIKNTNKYSMSNKEIRDEIIYKDSNNEGEY